MNIASHCRSPGARLGSARPGPPLRRPLAAAGWDPSSRCGGAAIRPRAEGLFRLHRRPATKPATPATQAKPGQARQHGRGGACTRRERAPLRPAPPAPLPYPSLSRPRPVPSAPLRTGRRGAQKGGSADRKGDGGWLTLQCEVCLADHSLAGAGLAGVYALRAGEGWRWRVSWSGGGPEGKRHPPLSPFWSGYSNRGPRRAIIKAWERTRGGQRRPPPITATSCDARARART